VTRILVALDDTDASHRAADFVHRLFGEGTTEVLAISVARVPAPWIPVGIEYGAVYPWPMVGAQPDEVEEAVKATTEEAEHTIHDSGLDEAEALVSIGDPVEEITRAAADHGADLIVVGSHHKNLLERFFQGSVSEKLVRDATIPVLVVP
jgi:nucleotide-binding universal stress UspA family protein